MSTLGSDTFEKFLKCRHSVRNFSNAPVDDETILRALAISTNTPSVCNRQGWFVHYYSKKEKIQELLTFQNGNAGFTESIDKLLIVTGSAKAFTRYEHNQLFIDGGLYSMNLMLSLHAVGLGSCPLNTCMPWFKAKKLKKAAGIPAHEQVIMMVAVGNLLDEFSVAQSEKYPVEKILRQH
jgi:nitroreductase